MILFLYGKPGAGKSVIGRALMFKLNQPFIECDDLYNEDERHKITTGVISDQDSDKYLEKTLDYLAAYNSGQNDRIIIATQSLFRESQRQRVKEQLKDQVFMVCLDIPLVLSIARVGLRSFQTGRGPERLRALSYSLPDYLREIQYYEKPRTFDLKVDNSTNNTTETVQKIIEEFRSRVILKR